MSVEVAYEGEKFVTIFDWTLVVLLVGVDCRVSKEFTSVIGRHSTFWPVWFLESAFKHPPDWLEPISVFKKEKLIVDKCWYRSIKTKKLWVQTIASNSDNFLMAFNSVGSHEFRTEDAATPVRDEWDQELTVGNLFIFGVFGVTFVQLESFYIFLVLQLNEV